MEKPVFCGQAFLTFQEEFHILIVEEKAGEGEKMNFGIIAPGEIERFVRDEESVIIDLRDREEFAVGHIVGAINIPYREWKAYEQSYEFVKVAAKKKIVLYCERGPTSFAVAKELAEKGIRVNAMAGGIHAYRGKMAETY